LGDPIKKWNEKLYALFLFEESILFFTYFTSNLKLRMNLYKVKVYNEGLAIGDNLADDCFIPMNPEKFNPAQKRIQMTFEYPRSSGRIPKHRNPNTGYSDHFPISGTIETLP